MKKDLRNSALYKEAEALIKSARQPGTGQISDAGEIHVALNGQHAVFSGVIVDTLERDFHSRICHVDLTSGDIRVLTFGPNTDRSPKFSPDGRHVAFLSDRHQAGDFQLYLLDPITGAARRTARVEGWVEYLQWSPDGAKILLGVAGQGADTAGMQGAVTSKAVESLPAWMPIIDTGDDELRWRRAWVYELSADAARQVSAADSNIWEANWCGNDALVAVVSPGPGEGLWYSASLHIVEIQSGSSREIYQPRDQLGWPAASPSGQSVAVVEAVCSDRWVVAGDLLLLDVASKKIKRIDTQGVDITHTEWLSDQHLLFAGHREPETVVGMYDMTTQEFTTVWSSSQLTTGTMGSIYAKVAALNTAGDFVIMAESFAQAPQIAAVRDGRYAVVRFFGAIEAGYAKAVRSVESIQWSAPDGLEIKGWLVRPHGEGPHPLVMVVHGGPVSHYRPAWAARGSPAGLMLLQRGYALFMPNPRGSAGRGQDFARQVVGDMGGADTFDYLSGIDHLVSAGIADPKRLGVMGISYGGYMSSWLITQDARFAAAIPVAPITNYVSHHLASNISHFDRLFLADNYTNPNGKYFQRSPVMHAHKVKTPTLNVCGALDRCTPPEEAVQFHNALLENGVESVLLTYPQEGHGVRKFPATIDYAARVVDWFEQHMR